MVAHPNPWRESSLNKPRFRGWLHTAMIPVSVIASVWLVVSARSLIAGVAAAIFGTSVTLMFVTSTIFTRRWFTDHGWAIARQVDQTAIYGLIAGTYTGLVGVSADDSIRWWPLTAVWGLTHLGIALRWSPVDLPHGLQSGLFVVLGIAAGVGLFVLEPETALMVGIGGALYIGGVIILGLRRPNPSPGHFGYHEIWHAMVVLALCFHFVAVYQVVS